MATKKNIPVESVNLDSVKKVIRDEFQQQKNDLINAVITDLGNVNIEHKADVDRQIRGFKDDIIKQITKVNKKVVGWPWFIIILLIWSILFFIGFVYYHNNYLSVGRKIHMFGNELFLTSRKNTQIHYSPITRGPSKKKYTDAQNDSIHESNICSIQKVIEKTNKDYENKLQNKNLTQK